MRSVTTSEFEPYGYLLEGDWSEVVSYLLEHTPLPKEGNVYCRDDEAFGQLKASQIIREKVFGLGQMESGYCNGNNTKLNCMEYHACPEVDVAATDLILILALPSDVKDGKLDSSRCKAFYVKKGQAVVLRPYVLHFSPCKAEGKPFYSSVYLAQGTNRDLEKKPNDPLLWKENKWLLAHPESKQAGMGAYIGITGENTEIL
jgi:hypothetical protein